MHTDLLFSWSVIHFIAPSSSISTFLSNPIFVVFIALTVIIMAYLLIQKFMDSIVTIGQDANWEPIYRGIRNLTFAKISFALSVLSFALSVLYNYIYLNSVGISLTKSPISLGDYTLTTLIWLPTVAVYFMLVLINIFIDSVWNPEINRWGVCKAFFTKFLVLIIPGYCFTGILLGNDLKTFDTTNIGFGITNLGLACIVASFLFAVFIFLLHNPITYYKTIAYPENSQSRIIDRIKFFVVWHIPLFIGVLAFLLFLIPKYAEVSTKCPSNGQYISGMHMLIKEQDTQINGVLARVFETHYLIRNCESGNNMNRMEFIRADRVNKITVGTQK